MYCLERLFRITEMMKLVFILSAWFCVDAAPDTVDVSFVLDILDQRGGIVHLTTIGSLAGYKKKHLVDAGFELSASGECLCK